MIPRRVMVTGVGPVTDIGVGAETFHRAQLDGISGTRHLTRYAPEEVGGVRVAGEVDVPEAYALTRRQMAILDRTTQLACVAARLALHDAELAPDTLDRDRVGVSIGTGVGGAQTVEDTSKVLAEKGVTRLSARFIPKGMCNNPAAAVAIEYGFGGPVTAPVAACASGAEALVAGYQMIANGEADVVLAGGTEAPLVRYLLGGFNIMGVLSRRFDDTPEEASRPFSADRDGFVLAEGAGILVLESEAHAAARGARPLAQLAGYGRTNDGYHITKPHPDGDGARRAVEAAMRHVGLAPTDISYINAHGTGTAFNDAAEVTALRRALGEAARRIPISSTKSQTGHAVGAAGAIEAIASVQAIATGLLPASINLVRPDPAFDMDFVTGEAREAKVTAVLSNSFGFGGHNIVLAFTAA